MAELNVLCHNIAGQKGHDQRRSGHYGGRHRHDVIDRRAGQLDFGDHLASTGAWRTHRFGQIPIDLVSVPRFRTILLLRGLARLGDASSLADLREHSRFEIRENIVNMTSEDYPLLGLFEEPSCG